MSTTCLPYIRYYDYHIRLSKTENIKNIILSNTYIVIMKIVLFRSTERKY